MNVLSGKFIILSILALAGTLICVPAEKTQAGGYGYQYPIYNYGYASYATPYVNFYDGAYHYQDAGYYGGNYYPAGNYAWIGGAWYLQNYGYLYPAAPVANNAIDYTAGWKKQLLNIAAARDKVEGRLRERALDQQQFLDAAKTLGFQGNFTFQNYGIHPGFPSGFATSYNSYGSYGGNFNPLAYGASANSLYGYTFSTIKDVYGDTSLNALYQQSSKLAENAQSLAGQAVQGHQDTVAQEGANRARVAEIIAKAQAAKVALDAANPQASAHEETRGQVQVVSPNPPQVVGQAPPPAAGPTPSVQAWAQLANDRCAACHSSKTGGGPKGGFNIEGYQGLSAEAKANVWGRLLTKDAGKRMPLGLDGKAGVPLTPKEIKLFVDN